MLDTKVAPGCVNLNVVGNFGRNFKLTAPLDTVGPVSLANESVESTVPKRRSIPSGAGAGADSGLSREEELDRALLDRCLMLNSETVSKLLQQGADVNAVGLLGMTPLGNAARNGRLEIIKVLLDVPGVNVMLPDEKKPHGVDGWNALLPSIVERNNDDDAELIGKLIALGLNPNHSVVSDKYPEGNGATAMYYAAEKGLIRTVKLLLSKGAQVNRPNHKNSGWSPLHIGE